jgi:hypothetical protein
MTGPLTADVRRGDSPPDDNLFLIYERPRRGLALRAFSLRGRVRRQNGAFLALATPA